MQIRLLEIKIKAKEKGRGVLKEHDKEEHSKKYGRIVYTI